MCLLWPACARRYATFAVLAGVDPTDDPPVPPLTPDPSNPDQDIYQGNLSYPPSDSINVWPSLISGNTSFLRPDGLVLSAEVLLWQHYKLLVAQPSVSTMSANSIETGWRQPNGTWVDDGGTDTGPWGATCNKFLDRTNLNPCLFDLENDDSEKLDLASDAQFASLVPQLWAMLNLTVEATSYISRSPAGLLGPCNATCAGVVWEDEYGGGPGPECGVPGC